MKFKLKYKLILKTIVSNIKINKIENMEFDEVHNCLQSYHKPHHTAPHHITLHHTTPHCTTPIYKTIPQKIVNTIKIEAIPCVRACIYDKVLEFVSTTVHSHGRACAHRTKRLACPILKSSALLTTL